MPKSKNKSESNGARQGAKECPEAMASITMATSGRSPEGTPEAKPKATGRVRGCSWTLFQYEKYLTELREFAKTMRYAIWGYEIAPETGRPHLQGYWYCDNKADMFQFSKKFGNCHVEKSRGTPEDNRVYCRKLAPGDTPNEKWEEFGELPTQGKRTDWKQALTDLKTKDVIDVIEDQPHLVPCQRALREVKNMFLKPTERDVKVIVLYGRGGTGKTRWAHDNFPGLYKKPVGDWWDGYSGQKTILLDDYYGYLKYHVLLEVLDRYPLNLPYKGGFVWAQYDTVVITSNKHPRDWYRSAWGWPLRRRLHKIIRVSSIDGKTNYEEEEFPASEEAFDEASCAIDD